jgi:hypothetical protein
MKIKVTFKTPDATDHAVEYLNEDEAAEMREFLSRWIKHGEYVTIEFDKSDGSARVIPCKS